MWKRLQSACVLAREKKVKRKKGKSVMPILKNVFIQISDSKVVSLKWLWRICLYKEQLCSKHSSNLFRFILFCFCYCFTSCHSEHKEVYVGRARKMWFLWVIMIEQAGVNQEEYGFTWYFPLMLTFTKEERSMTKFSIGSLKILL